MYDLSETYIPLAWIIPNFLIAAGILLLLPRTAVAIFSLGCLLLLLLQLTYYSMFTSWSTTDWNELTAPSRHSPTVLLELKSILRAERLSDLFWFYTCVSDSWEREIWTEDDIHRNCVAASVAIRVHKNIKIHIVLNSWQIWDFVVLKKNQ